VSWSSGRNTILLGDEYISEITGLLAAIRETQLVAIEEAAQLVHDSWDRGGRVMIARTNHCLHDEVIARAGGPLGVDVLEEVGEDIMATGIGDYRDRDIRDLPNLRPADVVVIHTNAGTTHQVVAIALRAAQTGARTVALTQLPYETSELVSARHPSGQRLHDVADVTIDLGGDIGDAMLELPRSRVRVAPSSGVTGMVAMWAILARACELVEQNGHTPYVLRSVQIPGASEHNIQVIQRWEESHVPFE
jgi:uncharacterized phosphosugar-binding protein